MALKTVREAEALLLRRFERSVVERLLGEAFGLPFESELHLSLGRLTEAESVRNLPGLKAELLRWREVPSQRPGWRIRTAEQRFRTVGLSVRLPRELTVDSTEMLLRALHPNGITPAVWRTALARLWNTVTGENVSAAEFLEHVGLLRLPQFVRVKNAADWVGKEAAEEVVQLTPETLAKKAPDSPVVLIIENEQTALSLDIPNVPIFLGLGYGVTMLEALPWLSEKKILYFGDLDTHGLAILAECRRLFAQTQSLLTDLPTFERFREFAVPEPKQASLPKDYLTDGECALAERLEAQGLRLEQERIPLSVISSALRRVLDEAIE